MKLYKLYIETYKESGEIKNSLILPVVRNNHGYGMFYWKIRNGEVYQFDVRTIKDAPAAFVNNKEDVEAYDNNKKAQYKSEPIDLIEVKDIKFTSMIVDIVFTSDSFIRSLKSWWID